MKHLPLILALTLLPLTAAAQKSDTKKTGTTTAKTAAKKTSSESKPELTPEELAAKALAEERAKRMEEMLPNTRALVFIDSLVVDKDNFLTSLRIPSEAGRYVAPERILPPTVSDTRTGAAAFVSSLGNTAFYSTPDSLGNLHVSVAYLNTSEWTEPQTIDELYGFEHEDYPFLLNDGVTLYFAATGDESIGCFDLFVTRYNEETRQYVRPQNLGFPYNSPANDYLLAIDEEVGIGALVTDRRQPDDKVCIYWFIAEERRDIYDYDPADEEAEDIVRGFAAISSIADTQEDHEDAIAARRKSWEGALTADASDNSEQYRFVISDHTVYTTLAEFKSDEARLEATRWTEAHAALTEMETHAHQLRHNYAATHSHEVAATLRKLEAELPKQRALVKKLEKAYRAAERRAIIE